MLIITDQCTLTSRYIKILTICLTSGVSETVCWLRDILTKLDPGRGEEGATGNEDV